jgi:hypothetical protein
MTHYYVFIRSNVFLIHVTYFKFIVTYFKFIITYYVFFISNLCIFNKHRWAPWYRTEESRARHYIDIGTNFYPISLTLNSIGQHSGWEVRHSPTTTRVFCSNPADVINSFWISDRTQMPISEWKFSVRHIFFRYRNNICRCLISPTLSSVSMPTYVSKSLI